MNPSQPVLETLADRIDALLPQTQCRQCGYDGCKPYAEAIARQQADINQCPPGGEAGIRALASLLGRRPQPLNTAHGLTKGKAVAVIDEGVCIGCTLCLPACPVDAIMGASKQMHSVLQQECTGCELCLPACPVDCIHMHPVAGRSDAMNPEEAALARRRHQFKQHRQQLETSQTPPTYARPEAAASATRPDAEALKKAAIAAAMARVKAQKPG